MKLTLVIASLAAAAVIPVHAAPKGGLGAAFGALLGGAAGNAVGKAAASPQSKEAALRELVQKMNATMPMVLDSSTRIDNLVAGPGVRFTYNYTITAGPASMYEPSAVAEHIRTTIKAGVCTHPDMQVFWKNGVTIGYSYRGNDGAFVAKQDITPRDCGY